MGLNPFGMGIESAVKDTTFFFTKNQILLKIHKPFSLFSFR